MSQLKITDLTRMKRKRRKRKPDKTRNHRKKISDREREGLRSGKSLWFETFPV